MTTNIEPRIQKDVDESRPRRPLISYALWIIQGLLALLFLYTGGTKLLLPLEMLTAQTPVPLSGRFVRFLGVTEVLEALGLILLGLLHVWVSLTPLAAAGLVIIMSGATVLTVVGGGGTLALIPLVIGLLAAFVAYARWSLRPLSD
ncbi:DoxX family protein [Haladaptatus halobius]|uniref:DoxX family protein n=1 Tax=Haladaptatus halobius TaxID=2884875 RepID=UPI001D0B4AAF|nr:DoxX family protein [Haladaptatus halobius]